MARKPPKRPHAERICNLVPSDRKSTRLNSSHLGISYAVFCLKKKNKINPDSRPDKAVILSEAQRSRRIYDYSARLDEHKLKDHANEPRIRDTVNKMTRIRVCTD